MPLPSSVVCSAAPSGRPPATYPTPPPGFGPSLRELLNASTPAPTAAPAQARTVAVAVPGLAAPSAPAQPLALALKCSIDGAAGMITATLKPLAVGRAALARQAKALQEMALALSHDPDIDRLLMIAADSNGQLAAFEEAGIHFTDIEPDAHLQHALQALTAAIIQVHVARPDMKLLPGLAGFLHQAECSRHVLANSTRTRDRVSAVAQWLNWQWAAPLEAEERQATGRPATLAELADRYGLREGGKEAGKILSLLWQQQITRHAAVLERSAPASALSTQGQQ